MSPQAKIFSVVAALLLIVPVVIGVQRGANDGAVLGVSETVAQANETLPKPAPNTTNQSDNQPNVLNQLVNGITGGGESQPSTQSNQQSAIEQKMKEISSGAREVKKVEVRTDTVQSIQGAAVWESNAKVPVTSDKFEIGTSVTLSYKGKKINVVVSDSRVLPPKTLVVLDAKTFQQLGADPEKETSVQISASQL